MEIRTNEPMARHTSFRVGGPADRFMIPESEGELREAVLDCKASGKPWYMVGNGSNLGGQVHHDKPLSAGGSSRASNLVLLCPSCHYKRDALRRARERG